MNRTDGTVRNSSADIVFSVNRLQLYILITFHYIYLQSHFLTGEINKKSIDKSYSSACRGQFLHAFKLNVVQNADSLVSCQIKEPLIVYVYARH